MSQESKPAVGRESDKFMLRFPDGMRERIAEEAAANGRSMNAEIITRLQASFGSSQPPFLPEIRIALDTGDQPISWDEIHEVISAVRKKMQLNAVSMQITVDTPELVSSATRASEAARLAAKLHDAIVGSEHEELILTPVKPSVKRVPRKPPSKKTTDK